MLFDLTTNIVYIIFFTIVYMFIFAFYKGNVNSKQFCWVLGVILFLGLACRDLDQGLNDTRVVYAGMYKLVDNMGWSELYNSILSDYTSPLFVTIMKLIATVTFGNFRIFMVIMAAIFIVAFERLFAKYSQNMMIAHLMFVAFIYPCGFYLIRQCLSMSFIAIAFYALLKNSNRGKFIRKYGACIFWCILAAMIHNIALVIVIAVIASYIALTYLKVRKKMIHIVLIAVIGAIIIAPAQFSTLLQYLPEGSKYSNLFLLNLYMTDGNLWLIPLFVCGLIAGYLLYRYKEDNSVSNNIMVICSLFTVLFVATTGVVEDIVRISYYFSIPTAVLMSNSFLKQNNSYVRKTRGQKYSYLVITCLALLYSLVITLPNNNIIYWS